MNPDKTLSGGKKYRDEDGLSIAERLYQPVRDKNAARIIRKPETDTETTETDKETENTYGPRPLTDQERAESAQRGFIRRDRRRKRYARKS